MDIGHLRLSMRIPFSRHVVDTNRVQNVFVDDIRRMIGLCSIPVSRMEDSSKVKEPTSDIKGTCSNIVSSELSIGDSEDKSNK